MLFDETMLSEHTSEAKVIKLRMSKRTDVKAMIAKECSSWFLDMQPWIEEQIPEDGSVVQGLLICPIKGCGKKLGSWVTYGA